MTPTPSAQTVTAEEWRVFDTTGTILNRTGNVLTITCESGEIANRVADQLRTPDLAAASARIGELTEELESARAQVTIAKQSNGFTLLAEAERDKYKQVLEYIKADLAVPAWINTLVTGALSQTEDGR